MRTKTLIFGLLSIILLPVKISAADHDVSVGAAAGISGFKYSLSNGTQSMKTGGALSLGYRLFFSPRWAVGTGVEFATYNSRAKIGELQDNYTTLSDANTTIGKASYEEVNTMKYYYKYGNVEELQTAYYLNIPVMVHYEGLAPHSFYVSAGIKIGIPMKATFEHNSSQLTTWGYFPYEGEVYENMPQHGFATWDNKHKQNKLSLGVNLSLAAEAGYRWNFSRFNALYVGAYADYGLNSINKKETKKPFLEYNIENATSPIQHSITNSVFLANKNKISFIDRLSTLSAGLKLQISFRLNR